MSSGRLREESLELEVDGDGSPELGPGGGDFDPRESATIGGSSSLALTVADGTSWGSA